MHVALKSQRKAKEPSTSSQQQQQPPMHVPPIGAVPSDQQQPMDVKPSLAEFKPPSVASLSSLGMDQSNPPSVLSTTSSGDAVAMETGQPSLSVKQEFMETSTASITMATAGGAVSANLDSKLASTMEGGSMLGLKRSASPQTSGPGSVGPPSTKSIKLEDDASVTSSLAANISQTSTQQQQQQTQPTLSTNTSQPQQQFTSGQSLVGTAGLSFSGPPISLSTTATAQVIASSIGGGNPSLGGVTMTSQGGGVVGRVLGSISTAAGSAGNPIQIGSPVTGSQMTFPTSMTQQSLASSASSTLPSSSIASGLFSTSQQSQMQAGGVSSQLGQLQTTSNLPPSSIQQQQPQQQQTLASSIAQNNPVTSGLSNQLASMGGSQQQQQQQGAGGISSLYGTTAPKVASMTSSYQQGIPQQQQQQQPMASMATTAVSMAQQQQPVAQFNQPGMQQAQRQTNLDAARKFAEMAKQQAEMQKSGQGVQPRSGPIGLQQPGSRPVIPGMANMVMQQQQQQQQQQQNVGGMGIGQGQGGMGIGQNQPGMNVLPGQQQPQQQQQQHQMGGAGNVASVSSSVGSMQQGGGGVTVTTFGGPVMMEYGWSLLFVGMRNGLLKYFPLTYE